MKIIVQIQCNAIDGRVKYFFFFNDTATTEIYTLSLHDALPIWSMSKGQGMMHFSPITGLPSVEHDHPASGFALDGQIGRAHV